MSTNSFFFYDLETTGVNPRRGRIMQFAGQRTDLDLNPIGDAYNILIKLTPDVLPSPDALLVTGITPQQTLAEGISEAEFIKLFDSEINIPGTIFTGFNSIRFDDEFMRFLFYRNFYEPYKWQWHDGRSRWDLLDVVRITRALRPDGIKWPFSSDGTPTNRLELLTELNKLGHDNAHDALSDVSATIAVAKLIKVHQPKLFDYFLSMRDKNRVKALAQSQEMFVYVSGKYGSEYEKLAVVSTVGPHPDKGGVLVYDLRFDPEEYLDMTPPQLVEAWKYKKDSKEPRLPVKTLRFNRCPAIAPMTVIREQDAKRLKIDVQKSVQRKSVLEDNAKFYPNLLKALEIMDSMRAEQGSLVEDESTVDERLYDSFIQDADRQRSDELLHADPVTITTKNYVFKDQRLNQLIPLYKARNYPGKLDETESKAWDLYRRNSLKKQLVSFSERFEALSQKTDLTKPQQFILEELRLYVEDILN